MDHEGISGNVDGLATTAFISQSNQRDFLEHGRGGYAEILDLDARAPGPDSAMISAANGAVFEQVVVSASQDSVLVGIEDFAIFHQNIVPIDFYAVPSRLRESQAFDGHPLAMIEKQSLANRGGDVFGILTPKGGPPDFFGEGIHRPSTRRQIFGETNGKKSGSLLKGITGFPL